MPRKAKRSYYSWKDLNNRPRMVGLPPQQAQVLDALMKGPVKAPSLERVASRVCELRAHGIGITTTLEVNPTSGRRFGTYNLVTKITKGNQDG